MDRLIDTDLTLLTEKYMKTKLDEKTIIKNRDNIYKMLNLKKNVKLTNMIIKKLFMLLDKYYFKNLIQDNLYKNNISIDFKISQDESILCSIEDYKDSIIKKIRNIIIYFSEFMFKKIQDNIKIHGVMCKNNIYALIIGMEHEITHLILLLYNSHSKGHNEQFIKIVNNMYLHTDIYHNININNKKLKDNKLKVGMKLKCNNTTGTIILLRSDVILLYTGNKIVKCRYTDYNIIDKNYKPYQKSIKELKANVKLGSYIQVNLDEGFEGFVSEINDNKVTFIDINTNKKMWVSYDFIKLKY